MNNLSRVRGRNILVLCYGNIYRSPFVATKLALSLDNSEWEIRSAGFYHKSNRPCNADYVKLARQFGIDLSNHQSRQVNEDDIEWADLIFIMDCNNRDLLCDIGGNVQNKIVWIAAWLGRYRADVKDPYGMPEDQVRGITLRLYQAVDAVADQLRRVSS